MSSSPSSDVVKPSSAPSPRLSVEIGGKSRELFMSFGLLNEISSLVGGVEGIPQLSLNPVISTAALELLLAPRDKRGNVLQPEGEDPDPVVPFDLDPVIAERILDWAGGHALDFFVRRFATSAQLLATRAGDLAAVGSSLTSSAS